MKKPCSLYTALCAALFAWTLCFGSAAHAQLTLTFDQPTLAGGSGSALSYLATLTNTGGEELFLNGDSFTLDGEGITLDDSSFFNNFPLSLSGGQSAQGELFTVMVGADVTPGAYTGSFTILGGPTDTDQNTLVTQTFGVAAAPEPGVGALFVSGLLLCGGIALRPRRTVARFASKKAL